jgi:hypothetical protein
MSYLVEKSIVMEDRITNGNMNRYFMDGKKCSTQLVF